MPNRPGPDFKRAIFFPQQGLVPKLVWVECKLSADDEYDPSKDILKLKPVLGNAVAEPLLGGATSRPLFVKHKFLPHRHSSAPVHLYHHEDYTFSDFGLNHCIYAVANGKPAHVWRGPVVALRMQEKNAALYDDFTLKDFRDIVNFIKNFKGSWATYNLESPSLRPKLKGVRINCEADIMTLRQKYLAIDVPPDHPVFLAEPSSISTLIGKAVQVYRYPSAEAWEDKSLNGVGPYDNQSATFLHMVTDPKDYKWGFAPMRYQNRTGSVVVVREDRTSISPAEIEQLCDFCQYKMQPMFEDASQAEDFDRSSAEVLAFMTPQNYARYVKDEHKSGSSG
ncbi:MAG: hypothetical protein Q9222_005884 [Ikaeria aurantiellina]